jgi:hypothetical protein
VSSRGSPPGGSGEFVGGGGGGGRRGEQRGAGPTERWNPSPPSPRATEAVEERASTAGAGVPAAERSVEEAARAAGVPVSAAGA